MNVRFGSLTISEIESRLGVLFSEEFKYFLAERKQNEASNIQPGRWHCSKFPFCIMCGDKDTAYKILDYLNQYNLKEEIKIGF